VVNVFALKEHFFGYKFTWRAKFMTTNTLESLEESIYDELRAISCEDLFQCLTKVRNNDLIIVLASSEQWVVEKVAAVLSDRGRSILIEDLVQMRKNSSWQNPDGTFEKLDDSPEELRAARERVFELLYTARTHTVQ
jgi:hypothetical protein